MSTVQLLPDDLNCSELKTLSVMTGKSVICEHLGLHKNTERISVVELLCVLFPAVFPGIDCCVHYGLRKFKAEGLFITCAVSSLHEANWSVLSAGEHEVAEQENQSVEREGRSGSWLFVS